MKIKIILPLAAALLSAACASFQSGNILLERNTLQALLEDKSIKPFSKIQVSWQNYPFRNPTDSIGEGSISNPKIIVPLPAQSEDLEYFRGKAEDVLTESGLYDLKNGSGTIKLSLTTAGRWTYHDLFRSFFVETPFVFIIPSSIKVTYALTAECAASSGTLTTEVIAYNKTAFHLLLAPLYPLLSPGAGEKSLIRHMIWRASAEIYKKMKSGAYEKENRGQRRKPDSAPGTAGWTETRPPAGPPEPPDRTWLPPKPAEGAPSGNDNEDFKPIVPETPDKTWVVPQAQKMAQEDKGETAQPAAEIKPAPPERTWIPATVPAQDADKSGAEKKP
ncbi:MAG: hypothetical protein NTX59_01845 [Elusimicrobia bacterium]|nr:hypothetical protein [Elusimicrobiota bacterium]